MEQRLLPPWEANHKNVMVVIVPQSGTEGLDAILHLHHPLVDHAPVDEAASILRKSSSKLQKLPQLQAALKHGACAKNLVIGKVTKVGVS